MKISISCPPIESENGVPMLSQNRQFQWFSKPTYIYPVIPAYAATLLKEAGHEVVWDDGVAKEKSYKSWLSGVVQTNPDLAVIETKTPLVKRHWKIINEIKQISPETKVVLVGDHVTALPKESMERSRADFVLTGGDYDFLLLNLVKFLEGSGQLEPGIWFRENGRIKNTGNFQLNHDLNSLPFIDRELTEWQLYSEKNGNYRKLPGTYTMAGRDCWHHKCSFCAWTVLYPSFRTRSPGSLLDEIGLLVKNHRIKEIMDDTGTFPVGTWLKKFCQGMIARRLNKEVMLDCNMRFGALSFEEYKLMKKAGFRLLLFGLESANQKTLDRVSKGLKVAEIVRSCKKAKEAGLEPHITIMFGYPWETKEDASKTLQLGKYLLKKGYADTVQATIVVPYPGTALFEECQKNNLIKTTNWDGYDMKTPVMKSLMKDEEIMGMVQEIYKVVFDPEFVIKKIMSTRNFDDVKFMFRAAKKVFGHIKDFSREGLT